MEEEARHRSRCCERTQEMPQLDPKLLTVHPKNNNLTLEKPGGLAREQADIAATASMDTASLLGYSSQRCTIRIRHKQATDDPTSKDSLPKNWPGLLKNAAVLRGRPRRRKTEEA